MGFNIQCPGFGDLRLLSQAFDCSIWGSAFGVLRLLSDIRRLVSGVQRPEFGVCREASGVLRLAFVVRHSTLVSEVQRSGFGVRYLAFGKRQNLSNVMNLYRLVPY